MSTLTRGIAVAGEIGMVEGVALRRAVALAVGQILQDRRHRMGFGILGQPDHRRQLDPVRQQFGWHSGGRSVRRGASIPSGHAKLEAFQKAAALAERAVEGSSAT
jgi:hypothetical protein